MIRCHNRQTERACFPTMLCFVSIFFVSCFSAVTQDALSKVYRFVPMQDFTANSDIDWSKGIEEIDAQLYAKYNLSDEEIAFIESMIKPMN